MALERPRFTTTSLREGYDMAEVDQAIDLVFDNLALPEVRFGAEHITQLRFTPVRLRQGYDVGEVDEWLDLAAAETERRATGGAPGEQAQTAHELPPAAEPQPTAAPERSSYEPVPSTAITEVRPGGVGPYLIVVAILVVAAVVAYALIA